MYDLFLQVYLILVSPFVGSFLSLCACRIPEGRSVWHPKSHCESCTIPLRNHDIIPIASFAILKGRCRTCGNKIPQRSLFVEIAAVIASLFAIVFFRGFESVLAACLGWVLLLLAVIDFERFVLPDRLVAVLATGALFDIALFEYPAVFDRIVGAILGGLLMGAISIAYRRIRGMTGLGFGDVKFVAVSGLWLGWQELPMMLVIAGLFGILHAVAQSRSRPVTATTPIPLGTWMAAAFWIIWLGLHGQL